VGRADKSGIAAGLALAAVAAFVSVTASGCAAGSVDPMPGTAGSGGQTAGVAGASGTSGTAGASGTSGGSGTTGGAGTSGTAGAGGSTACVMPPVAKMAWSIGYDATSPEITCAQAGAATVQLLMNSTPTQFPCSAKMGMSQGLPVGMSTPRVALAGSQGTVLSQGFLNAVAVPSCGVVDLGRLRFVVQPTGAAGSGGGGSGGTAGTSGTAGTGGGGSGGNTGAAGTMGGTGPCDAMPIFAIHSCAAAMACHDANGAAAHFDMKTAGWQTKLVGVKPSSGGAAGLGSVCIASGMPYLVAGSQPARGLFLDKLMAAKPACGAQMPLIPPNLTFAELDCVQRWANGLTK
jgi:hypothetical protein